MTSGVVFDIDDTLYLERDYVASGFRATAAYVEHESGVPSDEVFAFLWNEFESGVRGRTFDILVASYPELAAVGAAALVEVYRNHRPEISIEGSLASAIERLREEDRRIGVISDGPVRSQSAKVSALGLERWTEAVVLTDRWGTEFRKPHPRPFLHFEELWGIRGHDLAYIGDNPAKDFVTPNERDWATIRVRRAGQLHYEAEPPTPAHAPARTTATTEEACSLVLAGGGP